MVGQKKKIQVAGAYANLVHNVVKVDDRSTLTRGLS